MGVFVTPLEADMGWSRADITRVLSLGIFVGAVSFLATGYLHDRFGGRIVIGGALIMLHSYSINEYGQLNTLIYFYLRVPW